MGLKNCPRCGRCIQVGDGSLVPASCDKGTVPNLQPDSAAPGYVTAGGICCKHRFSAPQIRYGFLRSRSALTWTALSARWRARFIAALHRGNILSRCGYSIVDAIHLIIIRIGEGPLVCRYQRKKPFPFMPCGLEKKRPSLETKRRPFYHHKIDARASCLSLIEGGSS